MKANELLARQDRVVYILMVFVASLGLLWSVWQHQTRPVDAAAQPRQMPAPTPHQATFITR